MFSPETARAIAASSWGDGDARLTLDELRRRTKDWPGLPSPERVAVLARCGDFLVTCGNGDGVVCRDIDEARHHYWEAMGARPQEEWHIVLLKPKAQP